MKKVILNVAFLLAFCILNSVHAQAIDEQTHYENVARLLTDVTGIWQEEDEGLLISLYFDDTTLMMRMDTDEEIGTSPLEIIKLDEDYNGFAFNVLFEGEQKEWQLKKVFEDEEQNLFTLAIFTHHPAEMKLNFIEDIPDTETADGNEQVAEQIEAVSDDYTEVSFEDLLLDVKDYQDERVKITALGSFSVGSLSLSDSITSFNTISVETDNLSRDERKYILRNCSDLTTRCKLTVYGTAGMDDIFEQPIIYAERVE